MPDRRGPELRGVLGLLEHLGPGHSRRGRGERRDHDQLRGHPQPRVRPDHPVPRGHEQPARDGVRRQMRIHYGNEKSPAIGRTQARAGGAPMRIRQRRLAPRKVAAGAATMGILLAAAACSSSPSSGTGSGSASTINGAGSTFAAPMYQQWAGQYHASHGVQINYQAIGSGGGISEFTQGIVNFGATDAPMTATEQSNAQAGQGSVVLHVPMIIGAVTLAYNEPSVKNLRLDGPTLANIYLGKITHWNDPAIKALNPGVTLPSDPIQPVERADSSGTSYAFTSYLSQISPAWASQVGAS